MRILNVDDREDNRYLVEALFRGNGYEVHSVANGAEALSQLESSDFHVIISDILMPVMDGFELCRRVKKDERLRKIPFIAYTATYTGAQDEAFALQIGADRFIVKPCEPDVLLSAVRELLSSPDTDTHDPAFSQPAEEEVLKLYSERLVQKLEQKMLQLEQETATLRATQEALRTSEKKYRRLHESMTDGFIFFDMLGNILETNQSLCTMLGYGAEELSRMTNIDLTPEQWHEFEKDIVINQILPNDFSQVYEKEYIRKDRTIFPVELRTFLVRNDQGLEEGMWAIVRDLSDRKRAERIRNELENQLHQAQKMESVGRLAGGVAHDYNNMLSVILGCAELALKKTEPGSPLHSDLQEIFDAATRSANITRQLLAFARKQAISPQVLDLNATVEGALKILQRLIGEDITLVWQPEMNLWPVKIDPSQIDQILANLCVNARDAIEGVGTLTIETATTVLEQNFCIAQSGVFPGDYVVLSVSDTGCGMTPDILCKIFEPFFTTKEIGEGTGLGLATVYGIIKQNHGCITVASEPGKGTTFTIYLPRHMDPIVQVAEEKKKSPEPGRSETILIVEDEAAILRLAGKILKDAGYTVLTADNPAEAIAIARDHRKSLQLLITDVIMPKMNGRDLAVFLANEIPGLKCLFMSGYTSSLMTRQNANEQGIYFIQKPFSPEGLTIMVGEVLAAP
ncbi:MAG: response regulator [Desulforhopalus sp.]|nr:response regulator [Desulforhopalus sp.]